MKTLFTLIVILFTLSLSAQSVKPKVKHSTVRVKAFDGRVSETPENVLTFIKLPDISVVNVDMKHDVVLVSYKVTPKHTEHIYRDDICGVCSKPKK